MKLGVIVSPAAGWTYEELRALANDAERAGFESFWVSDHFFGGEGFPDRDCLEAWTLLAALARDTKKIRLGCLVAAAQYRNPALLAKTVAGVDRMSGGRLEFGIGAGWKVNEYKAYGYDFLEPGPRVDQMIDAIEICRRLWTEERATYAGKHYRVENAVCAPKPAQKPYPPLWVGGSGPRVMRVAARLADGFDIGKRGPGGALLTEDEMRAFNAELDAACRATKRDRPLLRSHWSAAEITDDISLRGLRDRIEAYARAGLDRYILAFPKERAAEMILRAAPACDTERGLETPDAYRADPIPEEAPFSWRALLEIVQALALAVVISVVLNLFIVQVTEVRQRSMEVTLLQSDRVLVSKVDYRFSEPRPGDIVVFNPTTDVQIPYVKRVVAVAGEVVELRNNRLFVNGQPRDFVGAHGATVAQSPDVKYPLRIPDGYFFAMGDNREASSDSRSFGPQPDSRIIGKVILRFWPLDRLIFFEW